jgi:ferrochelatase
MSKKGVLLINLGTPDSPSIKDVKKYLREFLMDKHVIDLPYLYRWFLVNVIIANFRAKKSAAIYQQLWTKDGSPLMVFGKKVAELLQDKLDKDYTVKIAMRYQNPSINTSLKELKTLNINNLTVIPLYPQYASSTTKSSIEKVNTELKKINYSPKLRFIENFITNEKFISTFAEIGNKYWKTNQFDKIIFSYHGVPERHILNDCNNGFCQLNESCCATYSSSNKHCYRAQCYETSRLIATKMNLQKENYNVVFQSRLETRARDPWLKPYADLVIADLPKQGVKNVLIFSPSFVADCLETTIEVGEEFKEIFIKNGGERWQLVESLNDHPKWIETLKEITLNVK